MCVCVEDYVHMCIVACRGYKNVVRYLGAGVVGGCEPCDMDARN